MMSAMNIMLSCALLALARLASAACEPWCQSPCSELNGDVAYECGDCTAEARCNRGAADFRGTIRAAVAAAAGDAQVEWPPPPQAASLAQPGVATDEPAVGSERSLLHALSEGVLDVRVDCERGTGRLALLRPEPGARSFASNGSSGWHYACDDGQGDNAACDAGAASSRSIEDGLARRLSEACERSSVMLKKSASPKSLRFSPVSACV